MRVQLLPDVPAVGHVHEAGFPAPVAGLEQEERAVVVPVFVHEGVVGPEYAQPLVVLHIVDGVFGHHRRAGFLHSRVLEVLALGRRSFVEHAAGILAAVLSVVAPQVVAGFQLQQVAAQGNVPFRPGVVGVGMSGRGIPLKVDVGDSFGMAGRFHQSVRLQPCRVGHVDVARGGHGAPLAVVRVLAVLEGIREAAVPSLPWAQGERHVAPV